MQASERIKRILKAGREQFAQFGYYGTRIDIISETSQTNKRLVYEYCHTKEGLYMAVLSDVSREVMGKFSHAQESIILCEDITGIYLKLLDVLESCPDFVRLWAWERLSPTIHGPRVLETALSVFERTKLISRDLFRREGKRQLDESFFEALERLCSTYLLGVVLYTSDEEAGVNPAVTPPPIAMLSREQLIHDATSLKHMQNSRPSRSNLIMFINLLKSAMPGREMSPLA